MKDETAGGYHPIPGFTPPTTPRGRQAVENMLDAAREHLLETGIENFSLREVARRAGYSPSALYNHFDGIETLINLLALEGVRALGVYLERVPVDTPAPQRLRSLGDAYLEFAAEESSRYRLAFSTLSAPERDWADYVATAYPFTLIVAACRDGLSSGELVDPRQVGAAGLAYALWCVVHGSVMLSAHQLGSIDADQMKTLSGSAIDTVIAGMTTREGTTP